MDELKHKAGEKLEALHVAAVTAAGNGKSRVQDVFHQTSDTLQRIRDAFNELWNNELIAEGRAHIVAWSRETIQRIRDGAPPLSPVQLYEELVALFHDRGHKQWNHELIAEGRAHIVAWSRETIQRIRDGAPPLSPVQLYEELVALFHDHVWRKSVLIFTCGVAVGGGIGVIIGLRASRAVPGPHTRALHSHPDQSVILVEDAVAPSLSAGEVLVRVQAFSVCALDRRTLRGRGAGLRSLLHATHVTVGRGFAGVVLDVGHGVSDLELGDEVWGVVSEWSGGAATELLTIRSTRVSKRPRSLSADGAAALPWAASEALAALQRLRLSNTTVKGKRVAICGACSGEGCVLVQLLSAWGARLTVVAPRHAALTLKDLGAQEYVDMQGSSEWAALESWARSHGPWDALFTCGTAAVSADATCNTTALLKATAPRRSHADLRPAPLISDRLPAPLYIAFALSFYSYRLLRWVVGCGSHTDFLEDKYKLREGLTTLTQLVDSGDLAPVLDKVYLPQEFENALAHACSDDAVGTTVVRFP